jgi:hypothetical protein
MLSRSVSPAACTFALAGASLLADVRDAQACGGCFHQPPNQQVVVDSTVVTDHRMAFALSPAQTVLWDQIRYTGNPSEFAWVLPVKAGARIELSQDAWMASLDASTQTVIQGPIPSCGGPPPYEGSGGGGCMGSTSSASGFAAAESLDAAASADDAGTVQVVSESVVGPYDAVTVRSSQGQALGDWLRANGYEVPLTIQPTIDAFTSEGFDFIALKLRPGFGVQAMQPVRVVTAGADPSLPLRMVAAGVGPNVGIELFILSEGRYHLQNFPDATIDFTKLEWDPHNNISNYETLATAAMKASGGTAWLTESSGPAALYAAFGPGNTNNPPLAGTYSATCIPLTLPPPPNCGSGASDDAGGEASATVADASSEAGDEGGSASDGAVPEASSPPVPVPSMFGDAGACSSVTVPCDDLDLAMTGITGPLWVTRVRAFLPASALANDIILEAAPSQDPVPSFHTTSTYTDPKYSPCPNSNGAGPNQSGPPQGGCACRTAKAPRNRVGDAFLFGVGAVLVGLSLRRRRR